MSTVLQQAVAKTKRDIKIVYAREAEGEALPAGGINLDELISTKGEKSFLLMVNSYFILSTRSQLEQP